MTFTYGVHRMFRLASLVRRLRTGTLERVIAWMNELPPGAMPYAREEIARELLARELAALTAAANETGPWRCVPCGAVN